MPAQDKLTEDMPAQGELVEEKLGKLHQMEADSPAVIVIAYMCMIGSLEMEEGADWNGPA
jgi:hypothetical protein